LVACGIFSTLGQTLSYDVGVASRFMERPTTPHLKAVKHILRYVKGTVHYGLVYQRHMKKEVITGYSDSDLAGDIVDRRSTGGIAFYVNDSLISWRSQKQKTVALSSEFSGRPDGGGAQGCHVVC
jgi:hypothetical protein